MSSIPKLAAAVVLVIIAIVAVVCAAKPSRPPLDRDLHSQVGRVLAEETAARLGGQGKVVVIVPEAAFDMPLVKSQYSAFEKHLPKGITIEAREMIRLEQMGSLDGLLTPERFFEYVGRHPATDAIVSFVGLGEFCDADIAKAGGKPPLFTVTVNVPVPRALFKKRLVQMSIEPRRGSSTAESGRPGRESFDLAYVVVTSETASSNREK